MMVPHTIINTTLRGETRRRLLPELVRRFGGDDQRAGFVLSTPDDDPRVAAFVQLIESNGVRRMPASWDYALEKSGVGFYTTIRIRKYDDSDFQTAEYLWLSELENRALDVDVDVEGTRGEDGVLCLVADSVPKNMPLVSAGRTTLFVTSQFRVALEAAQFVGMFFRPTRQVKEGNAKQMKGASEWSPYEPPSDRAMWEIRPTVTLARMHRDVQRVPPPNGQPHDARGPGRFKNEGFDDVQLVYARSDLQRSGAFDIAHAWEFTASADEHPFIVSQRFYQFCKAKKIQTRFVPVKIVEGE